MDCFILQYLPNAEAEGSCLSASQDQLRVDINECRHKPSASFLPPPIMLSRSDSYDLLTESMRIASFCIYDVRKSSARGQVVKSCPVRHPGCFFLGYPRSCCCSDIVFQANRRLRNRAPQVANTSFSRMWQCARTSWTVNFVVAKSPLRWSRPRRCVPTHLRVTGKLCFLSACRNKKSSLEKGMLYSVVSF